MFLVFYFNHSQFIYQKHAVIYDTFRKNFAVRSCINLSPDVYGFFVIVLATY